MNISRPGSRVNDPGLKNNSKILSSSSLIPESSSGKCRLTAQRYSDLPQSYHRWKWRVLLAFAGFYLFLYLGRFNFWPVAPLAKEDLGLSHVEIGLITALLMWGFGLGDLVHGRLAESYGLRLWVLLGAVLTTVFNWITSFGSSALALAIPWGINGFVNAACWSPGISMISHPALSPTGCCTASAAPWSSSLAAAAPWPLLALPWRRRPTLTWELPCCSLAG